MNLERNLEPEDVLNFIHENMGRELTDLEINGITELVFEYGTFKLKKTIESLKKYAEDETIDSYLGLEVPDGKFGINDCLSLELKDDEAYDLIQKGNYL